MILNHNHIPTIRDGKLTYIKYDPVVSILNKISGLNWYMQIADTNSFAEDVLSLTISNYVLNNSRCLIIHNSFEGFHEIVDCIYKHIVIGKNIPETKIIFVSESFNILSSVEFFSKKYNKLPIKTYYLSAVEHSVASQLNTKTISDYCLPKKIEKTFLCLNRRWRPHRPSLVALLHVKNLLEQGHVSLEPNVDGVNWHNYFDRILELNMINDFVYHALLSNKNKIQQLPSLNLDAPLKDNGDLPALQSFDRSYYDRTMFSVITETLYYSDENFGKSIFITEKTYKAIANMHPFILLSAPNSLGALKNRGYKTFSPIINEDYDTEQNDATRLLMVVTEIERLANLSQKEKENFVSRCKDICEHNFKVLLSRKNLGNCFLPLN